MQIRVVRIWIIFLAVVWIILFLGAGTVSVLPYSMAKVLADKVSLAGNSNRFTVGFFAEIQKQAHWITLFLIPVGIILFLFRKKIEELLSERIPSLSSLRTLIDIRGLSRREILWLLIVTGAGLGIRLIHMQGIVTYDEAFTYFQYAQSPLTAVTVYTHVNNHIFHTFLLSLITSILGDSYWVLRFIALVSGTLLIPMVFLMVRCLQSDRPALSGWLAAVVISVNPLTVNYSAMARGYTLQALIGLLTWFLFVRIYQGRRDLNFILGVLCALALWTIPTSSYLVCGLGIASIGGVILRRIKSSDFVFFIMITGIVTVILWSPAVIVSGVRAVLMNQDVNPLAAGMAVDPFGERFKYLQDPLSLYMGWPGGFGLVILLTFWGMYTAPMVWRWLGLGVFTSIFLLTALFQVTPPLRTWVFLEPFIAILIDFGVVNMLSLLKIKIKKTNLIVGVLAVVYVLLVLPVSLKYDGPGHGEVTAFARAVASQWSKGQAIKIQANKTGMLQFDIDNLYITPFYGWYNVHTVKYYLKRQGIPESAFRWRRKSLSPTVWLISVRVDGKNIDLQGSEEKRYHWVLIRGPYALAKNVDKMELAD